MIGPQLEKMILNGEAVFRTATIGYGALQALSVPKGKSYVITDLTIQPFANIISDDARFAREDTFFGEVENYFENIMKRASFQLLMYNSRGTNNRWTFRNEMKLTSSINDVATPITNPSLVFKEKKIECYVLIEELTWFYFLFPSYNTPNLQFNQAPLNTIFENVNQFPQAPFGFGTQETLEFLSNEPGPQFYSPLGLQDDANIGSNTTPTYNVQNIDVDSTLVLPTPDGTIGYTDMLATWDPSFPIINISYVEINKRTTTSGIV